MLTQNSAVIALTADHLFLCESSSAHLLSRLTSCYPEPTKGWVPISPSLFCNPQGVKKKICTQASRRQKAKGISNCSDGWFLRPEQPCPFSGVQHNEEAPGASIFGQGGGLHASALLNCWSKRAEWPFCSANPRRYFFFHFLARVIHQSQQTQGKDGMRCTSWSEVGRETAPAKPYNKSAVFPVSRQQHLWNELWLLGYCFIVPHGSNLLGRCSFGYYFNACHHRTQASTPQSLLQKKTTTQEKIMVMGDRRPVF